MNPRLDAIAEHARRITSLARAKAIRAMLSQWVSEEEPTLAYDRAGRLIGLAARDVVVIELEQPI